MTDESQRDPHAVTDAVELPWLRTYPEDIDWAADVDQTPLPQVFQKTAGMYGDHGCIDFLGKRYTYAEISELVDRTVKGLQEIGVEKGTRVGIYLPNTPYYVVFYLAVLKAGGIVVNFNPLYAKNEVLFQLKDSGARIMVTLDVDLLWSKVDAALNEELLDRVVLCRMSGVLPFPKNLLFPIVRRKDMARVNDGSPVLRFEDLIENDGQPEPVEILPEDRAIFQYTGGTTGTPKGAVLRHGSVAGNAQQVRMLMPTLEFGGERFLGVLPLCHVFAMTAVMNVALVTGSEMILLPRFELDQLLGTIQRRKPTIFPGVPAIYGAINESKRLSKFDLSSLKFCISGGAPLPLEVKRRFEMLTDCRLVEGYGLSESSPVATCNPLFGESKEGSIGQPVPGTRIEIRAVDDPGRTVEPGERGEVCIQGPQVMEGYWNRPDETAETLHDGWLRTGDVGYMDDAGYTFIVDRMKDVIFRGGYNVYPRVIEEAIYEHPFVAEVSVVGVDGEKGQYPKAFVRLKDDASLTQQALLEFLEDRLSKLEMPKEVEFRSEHLPKTMIGKPSKKHLREEEEARRREESA